MLKGQKGITLIALVITVIVLLILAGVAISMLSGNDTNIYSAANSASSNYNSAAVSESTQVSSLVSVMSSVVTAE